MERELGCEKMFPIPYPIVIQMGHEKWVELAPPAAAAKYTHVCAKASWVRLQISGKKTQKNLFTSLPMTATSCPERGDGICPETCN